LKKNPESAEIATPRENELRAAPNGAPKKQTDTCTKLEKNPACVEIAAVAEKRSFAKTHS
jgi:hypothetical protein